jgi:hypothetical protein
MSGRRSGAAVGDKITSMGIAHHGPHIPESVSIFDSFGVARGLVDAFVKFCLCFFALTTDEFKCEIYFCDMNAFLHCKLCVLIIQCSVTFT